MIPLGKTIWKVKSENIKNFIYLISAQPKCGTPAKPVATSLSVLYSARCPVPCLSTCQTEKNTSPAKKLRAIKRLLTFLSNKSPVKLKDVQKSLTISPQESFSFSPPKLQPNLVASPLSSIDIPPVVKKISNLNIVKSQSISIPPRPVYHPTIINACTAMFAKHPSQLRPHEVEKFNYYRKRKSQIGEPLEQEIIYLPSGGLQIALTQSIFELGKCSLHKNCLEFCQNFIGNVFRGLFRQKRV